MKKDHNAVGEVVEAADTCGACGRAWVEGTQAGLRHGAERVPAAPGLTPPAPQDACTPLPSAAPEGRWRDQGQSLVTQAMGHLQCYGASGGGGGGSADHTVALSSFRAPAGRQPLQLQARTATRQRRRKGAPGRAASGWRHQSRPPPAGHPAPGTATGPARMYTHGAGGRGSEELPAMAGGRAEAAAAVAAAAPAAAGARKQA